MHVEHLLGDASLGLRLLWAEDALMRREISGVTVTDLEDPARFVRPGEVVLSGLVWWSPDGGSGKAERFVSALKDAGAAALLAGEETHGSVPDDLVEACVRHRVPVAGVPAHIMFRSITDTVYLRQWGGLSRHHALPENTRVRLSRLLAQEAGPDAVLAAAFAHLGGTAAYVFTASGRTVAATAGAAAVPAREAVALVADGSGVTASVDTAGVSAYERRLLYLPDPDGAPPSMLHEVAAALARCQEAGARRPSAGSRAADELGALLAAPGEREDAAVEAALRRCGLPETGPYRAIVADAAIRPPEVPQPGVGEVLPAEGALAEVAAHLVEAGGPAEAESAGGTGEGEGEGASAVAVAVGRLPDGCAFAVLAGGVADGWADEAWQLVADCAPGVVLHGGMGVPAAEPEGLGGALAQARYALTSARSTAPGASRLIDAGSLTTLDSLLTGVPADVRAAYSHRVLGPLLESDRPGIAALLSTLETFLACDGSWARTAQELHLHVNTVHYRMERVERLTGRDLSRLRDRLDLWAALMCR
ncbi:PucR family transcriptional regulator [Streptomyces sp. IMTB 2501]|uniref:PucR family transcriptional regulator n=1 Tax=Streptomyces sp. IMTB 2501 TaxID=1776340 RepID=UPI00096E4B2A|nr:PucR family transcriptional regulator [Streptomyces sp. IMTB 2501]OLZ72254.1 PucR family transcriptional regulator [Streptomyces sp. IMTB 2501]